MVWLAIYLILGAVLAVALTRLDIATRGTPFGFVDILKFVLLTIFWLPGLIGIVFFVFVF